MEVLTVIQFLQAFCLYLLVVIWLPSLILRKRLEAFSLSVRYLFYFTIGNFYIINLVYILQLLKISNWLTLIFGTALPIIKVWKKDKNISFGEKYIQFYEVLFRIFSGRYGIRLVLLRVGRWVKTKLKNGIGRCFRFFCARPLDCLLMLAFFVLLGFLYGRNLVLYMGYGASDIPVHTLWVNSMEYLWPWEVNYDLGSVKQVMDSWNNIFVKGVYPFGMHNIIYYLHAVSGMDIYVLFRIFWLVQDIVIFMMPVFVIKALCRTRYAAYISSPLYLILATRSNTYSRYYSTLPQEAGMMFILPTGYFLIAFLIHRRQEIKEGVKLPKKKLISSRFLAGFCMALSLTFTVHFYDTFAVAFLCLGIAGAFFFRILRKGYIGRLIIAGLLSIFIGALPLVLGFVMGKGAQGSLGWGLSIITGSNKQQDEEPEETEEPQGSDSETGEGEVEWVVDNPEDEETLSLQERITGIITSLPTVFSDLQGRLSSYIFSQWEFMPLAAVFIPALILLVIGLLSFIGKKPDYGGILWSAAIHQLLLVLLLSLNYFDLPELMDPSRASIYFAYGLPLLWGLAVDGVVSLFFGRFSRSHVASIVTVGIVAAIFTFTVREGFLRNLHNPTAVWQTNSSVACLTNIIRDRKDHTWTICSANDVTRQVQNHGYHYEAITFLQDIQYGRTAPQPTPWMYFFVEKIPINYNLSYPGSGQSVSIEGAERDLPPSRGISQYQGENRWVIMSKIYYWGQEFMKRFPNQMRVYYETEDFICYEVRQNVARLFNFVIPFP